MELIKHVPTGSALRAVSEALDSVGDRDGADAPFFDWYSAERGIRSSWGGRGSVLDTASVPLPMARDLLAEVPDTPCGRAWKDAFAATIAKTEADAARPFDTLVYDTEAEAAAVARLDEIAEAMRAASPLLNEVAGEVEGQSFVGEFTVGDVFEARARITADGIVVGSDGHCEKHDEDCYGDRRSVARWEHIEAIHPGVQAAVRAVLADLDADLPEVADGDNGRARRLAAGD